MIFDSGAIEAFDDCGEEPDREGTHLPDFMQYSLHLVVLIEINAKRILIKINYMGSNRHLMPLQHFLTFLPILGGLAQAMDLKESRNFWAKNKNVCTAVSCSETLDDRNRSVELIPDVRILILGFLGPYEHIQLARTNTSLNNLCARFLAPLRNGPSLSLYNVFSCFQSSTGYQRESCKLLLNSNSIFKPLKGCLAEDGPLEVSGSSIFSNMFKYIGVNLMGYPGNPLYSWLLESGKALTTDMIRIAVENVNFVDLEYWIILEIIDKIELGRTESKQLLVSLFNRYPALANSFDRSIHKINKFSLKLSVPTIIAILEVASDLKRKYDLDPRLLTYYVKEGHYDLVSIMLNISEKCDGLEVVKSRILNYQTILLHSPQIWCLTEERLKFALKWLVSPDEIEEFLFKLTNKIGIKKLSNSFCRALMTWIERSYPERLFEQFLIVTADFEASSALHQLIIDSHCDANYTKWNPSVIFSFLCSAGENLKLNKKQFLAITTDADQHVCICLATLAEKGLWLIKRLMLAGIPPLMLRHLVLQYRQAFLDSYNVMTAEELIEFGKSQGYDRETMDFIVERIYPKQAEVSEIVPSCENTQKLYMIASSSFKAIRAAESVLSDEAFQDLLLYDPARWCYKEDAVHFAMKRITDAQRRIKFLDCLPRRRHVCIYQKTFQLALQSPTIPEKLFLRLLEKFPSSTIQWFKSVQHPEINDCLSEEEKLILYQREAILRMEWDEMPLEIFICYQWEGNVSKILKHLVSNDVTLLMIKCFCTKQQVSLDPNDYTFLAKAAERHKEKDLILETD